MTEKASQVDSDNRKRKQYAQQDKWIRKNTISVSLRFTLNSGIPQALKAVCEQTGTSETQYVRNAVIQALQ